MENNLLHQQDDVSTQSEPIVHLEIVPIGRKTVTRIHGIDKKFNYTKIMRALMRQFATNGSIQENEDGSRDIHIHGDHLAAIRDFLWHNGIVMSMDNIIAHK